ncbi:MAG: uL14 family ribosomal protein [Nanoarchaeota archaeon]|nr:uL14 family ribosomal protein [Nanoarchaeota archaeon]
MQSVKAKVTRALPIGSVVETCDNSGARVVKIFTVIGKKGVKGRREGAGVGDLVMVAVKKGKPEMRKQTTFAVVVRQKKEYRRPTA